ncbi:MAG: Fe-S oxidoreductase, partial [Schleiferiaceae bacterium]|nr:Fe-S oxidoreductase [Schleiferiaceae bacterium]
MIEQGVFLLALAFGAALFARQIIRLRRGLALARPSERNDRQSERWTTMLRVAMGQSKMGTRPLAAFFHLLIYVGFVLINLEVVEILLDGALGSHRIFEGPLGGFYPFLIGFFEILAVLVLLACVVFIVRRAFGGIGRFNHSDMTGWPNQDAHIILYTEIVLMLALLLMNVAETARLGTEGFVVSRQFASLFDAWDGNSL